MLKTILASVGIGAAKVDTVLENEHLKPGQNMKATIHIKGGDVEQEINGLQLALMTKIKVDTNDGSYYKNHLIERWRIDKTFTIQPNEETRFPFEAVLNAETPITVTNAMHNVSRVWIETGLDIDLALDPSDQDFLHIYPSDAISTCMQAMEQLGFQLVKADVEKGHLRTPSIQTRSGCYQELEYRLPNRSLFGIQEVELSFISAPQQTHVVLEIDRAFRGDGYTSFTLDNHDLDANQVSQYLKRFF